MENEANFATELRRLRRSHSRGISLADIADEVGCSVTYVSAIERGERNPPSNEKIRVILQYLGVPDQYDRMVDLAIKARKAVEIPIDGTSPQLTNVLLGLARRSEQGLKDDDPLVIQLTELLKKDDEEERKCRPLFHESQQNLSDKSKTTRRRS